MYRITNNLATVGLGVADANEVYDSFYLKNWLLIDVRHLKDDGSNTPEDYMAKIDEAGELIDLKCNVVIGCVAGESRSNSIALGVLVKYFHLDFYDAWELVKKHVPICHIDPSHINKLKKLFGVTLP